jgi:4-hydroxybenzoate polyprenyltransferase
MHWMRSHMSYFLICVAALSFVLIWIPNNQSSLIYAVPLVVPFIVISVQFYYSYMKRLHYRRWGGNDEKGY